MQTKEVTSDDFYYGRSLTDGNADEWDPMDERLTELGVDFEIKYISSKNGSRPFGKAWRMKRKEAFKLPWDLDPEDPDTCIKYWGKPEAPYIPINDMDLGHGIYPLLRNPLDWGDNCIITEWQPCQLKKQNHSQGSLIFFLTFKVLRFRMKA